MSVSPYRYLQSEKKHWNSCWHGCYCHHCIAKVPMTHNAAIRAVARAGEGKDRSFDKITANWVMTQFAVHPIEGSFGNEFPSICCHCRVMAAWSRKTWKESANFLVFFWKMTPYWEIFKVLFQSMCCVQISWNMADGRSVKLCIAYIEKKNLPGTPARATVRITPKICQGQPEATYSECSRTREYR